MRLIFFSIFLLAQQWAFTQQAGDIVGVWLNAEKTAKIEIAASGDKYNGKIVWLSEPLRDGKPKLDIHNEDAALRNRPILGLKILNGFEWDDGEWDDGTIYDPKNGKTYSCYIKKQGNELHVTGYIGLSFIGRTAVWTKSQL